MKKYLTKKLKTVITYAAILVVLTSCETLKVVHYGATPQEVKKVTILSVMIDKIYQPTLPLIDAGIFNAKTNNIANEIIILQQARANEYRKILANSFENHFHCQVIYGDSLHVLQAYKNLKLEYNRPHELYTGNDNFPTITISQGDMNPFLFQGERVQRFFQEKHNYEFVMDKIAQELDSDYTVLSVSQLSVQQIGPFWQGSLALLTKLYIFNHEGILVSEASNISQSNSISGKDPEQYDKVLRSFSTILEPMMNEIEARYKTKNQN
jgi:hypothetical protein